MRQKINITWLETETPSSVTIKHDDHGALCEAISWMLDRPLTPQEKELLRETMPRENPEKSKGPNRACPDAIF